MAAGIVIGLSAVVFGLRRGELRALTVRPHDLRTGRPSTLTGLPFGPFDPEGHRTFELALRAFVARQTGFDLGYVEQLYTFGDEGRDAPLADAGPAGAGARIVSVGYLALTDSAPDLPQADTRWTPVIDAFPWEDWRRGRPAVFAERVEPALRAWAGVDPARRARAAALFALDQSRWNEERVLDRYELLYEAGLAPEAARDRALADSGAAADPALDVALGRPMISDHRRILATGLGRLRSKLKYRPVVFDLMPGEFTLSALQRTVEAVSGVALHKQNFRRMVERTDLAEPLGRYDADTGGRPAELHRRRSPAPGVSATGFSLPPSSPGEAGGGGRPAQTD